MDQNRVRLAVWAQENENVGLEAKWKTASDKNKEQAERNFFEGLKNFNNLRNAIAQDEARVRASIAD